MFISVLPSHKVLRTWWEYFSAVAVWAPVPATFNWETQGEHARSGQSEAPPQPEQGHPGVSHRLGKGSMHLWTAEGRP